MHGKKAAKPGCLRCGNRTLLSCFCLTTIGGVCQMFWWRPSDQPMAAVNIERDFCKSNPGRGRKGAGAGSRDGGARLGRAFHAVGKAKVPMLVNPMLALFGAGWMCSTTDFWPGGHPLGAHRLLREMHPQRYLDSYFPLNGHFDAGEMISAHCPGRCNTVDRLEIQTHLYMLKPIFGILENKLLVKIALKAAGIPTMGLLYGALTPEFKPQHLEAAVARAASQDFVLKSVADGAGYGVEMFDTDRWRRESWSAQTLGQKASQMLNASIGRWGQTYQHNGIILEPRYDLNYRATGASQVGANQAEFPGVSDIWELKATTVFGVPMCVLAHPVPAVRGADKKRDAGFVFAREWPHPGSPFQCANATRRRGKDPADQRLCEHVLNRVVQLNARDNLRRLDVWAVRTALLFGADWFRLDVLTGNPQRGWAVNEVTYPSSGHADDHCEHGWSVLTEQYKRHATSGLLADAKSKYEPLPGDAVLEAISRDAKIDVSFFHSIDAVARSRIEENPAGILYGAPPTE
mmetsp:Transcript_4094/g.11629  ORF Transcript_4094/g.11629 Transcript_4094/m.11629 type:complete len:518 (-) Transcript_4094:106-1659(-)